MYQNFVGSSLALMLTLDKPEHQWLAEYFVARYPTSAESNPTLPRHLVAERLKKNLLANRPVDHLLDAHVLTPAPWRAVLDSCSPQGLSVEYLVTRQWPRKGHMVAAAVRDDTAATATLLVRNASTRSFWSLPLTTRSKLSREQAPARACHGSRKVTIRTCCNATDRPGSPKATAKRVWNVFTHSWKNNTTVGNSLWVVMISG